MKKFFNTNWFTLVELMISIAIIGILAAVLFPSVTGYFERARDTAKKQNMRQLELALISYYWDTGTYKIPDFGYLQNWRWFVNYYEPNPRRVLWNKIPYKIPMDEKLRQLWYTNLRLKTLVVGDIKPSISESEAGLRTECFETPAHKDLYYFHFDENTGEYSLFGFLERATEKDMEKAKTKPWGLWNDGACSRWGLNYVIGN